MKTRDNHSAPHRLLSRQSLASEPGGGLLSLVEVVRGHKQGIMLNSQIRGGGIEIQNKNKLKIWKFRFVHVEYKYNFFWVKEGEFHDFVKFF